MRSHGTSGRSRAPLPRAVCTASLALLLAACADETVEVPAEAVSAAGEIVGSSLEGGLPLAAAEVDRLAGLANVEQSVLESVATSLADHDVWVESLAGVRTVHADAPDGVRPTLVEVACDAVTGNIYTDYQLHYAIYQRVTGFDEGEIDRLTEATLGLYQVMYDAGASERPEDRAAAVLTCHTLEETQR